MNYAVNATGTPDVKSITEAYRIARLGDRVIAATMDGLILLPIFIGSTTFTAYIYGIPPAPNGNISVEGWPAIVATGFDLVFWCAYYFVSEWLFSTTLGKEAMGIEVRSLTGAKCNTIQALLRNLCRPIDAIGFYLIGFIAAAFSPSSQRLGDRAATTIVVEKPSARRKLAVAGWLVLNLLLFYLAVHF